MTPSKTALPSAKRAEIADARAKNITFFFYLRVLSVNFAPISNSFADIRPCAFSDKDKSIGHMCFTWIITKTFIYEIFKEIIPVADDGNGTCDVLR